MSTLLNATGGIQAILGSPLFMFIIIIAIMYFMMIRPQRKQQKKIDTFRKGLQVGQEVVTSGGIYGKIKSIENGMVMLEVAHNVVVRVDISVIYPNPSEMQEGR